MPVAPLLAVEVVPDEGGIVLRVRGEIDTSTATTLRDALEPHLGPEAIIVDLADVTFIDSSGLTVILVAHRKQVDQGGTFWVRNPTGIVRRVLAVTDLEGLIEPT